MAKNSGDTRVSRWPAPVIGSNDGEIADLYFRDGRRVEYSQLSTDGKKAVKQEKRNIAKALAQKLSGVTTPQVIDNGEKIEISYTGKGIDHFCNDAMLTLSGKYFSKESMMNLDKIIAQAAYVPTGHGLNKPRTDGRDLWFSYSDNQGRGVYFKVTWNTRLKKYELYSVTEKL